MVVLIIQIFNSFSFGRVVLKELIFNFLHLEGCEKN